MEEEEEEEEVEEEEEEVEEEGIQTLGECLYSITPLPGPFLAGPPSTSRPAPRASEPPSRD